MIIDILADTSTDCLKMLPYLFAAFLLLEALEQYSNTFTEKVLSKVGKAGPMVGALLGCVPQCGFSIMAANLYAGGVISVGTLLSVFIATSDEAILIMLGNPGALADIGFLVAVKVAIAVFSGYLVDLLLADKLSVPKESGKLCRQWADQEEEKGVIKAAWEHTARIFVYLFVFTGVLNLCVEIFGVGRLSAFLLGDSIFQPVIAAMIGLIPNCAASVILTQLYLGGAVSFASVIAGLCTGAGIGLVVLCKVNQDRQESVRVIGILFVIGVTAGLFLELLM
mgnify:CR=1 FL=1|jgi:hypothetical protein